MLFRFVGDHVWTNEVGLQKDAITIHHALLSSL